MIIYLIESNLALVSAAYPSVRSFLNKVSTGFLAADTTKHSQSGSKSGSYGLQTIGSAGKRNFGSRIRDTGMILGDEMVGKHTATVKGDTKSDRSFGSEVIMVRRSVEIDEISSPDS